MKKEISNDYPEHLLLRLTYIYTCVLDRVRDGTARWMTPTPSQYRAATPYTDTSGGPTVVWSVTPPSCVLCPRYVNIEY